MIVATALMALALLFPVAADTPCADVVMIGVPGSGQEGLGRQVRDVTETAERLLPALGRTVEVRALDYPAISLADSFGLALINGDYARSVSKGAENLLTELESVRSTCPHSSVALVGYSQGAQVIKTAAESLEPESRIGAVVLLADPTRSAVQSSLVRLGDPSALRDGAFGGTGLPHHIAAVTIDVCAPGDGVCERGRRDLAAHVEGYEVLTPDVAAAMQRELGARSAVGRSLR